MFEAVAFVKLSAFDWEEDLEDAAAVVSAVDAWVDDSVVESSRVPERRLRGYMLSR